MIELERHIEILLLRNDCVIVPGLGGFIASHIPATYDERDCLFLPPQRTLGFNPKLKINDSLLVQSYTEAYDISYPDAQNRISGEVNELKQIIYNEGSYELCDIGTLYLNNDGNLEFKPCEAGILTPDLYSLSSFEMKREEDDSNISKENDVCHENRANSDRTTATVTFSTSPLNYRIKENDVLEEKFNESSNNTPSTKIKLFKSVLAVFIAIITFFAWSSPINNNNKIIQMGNMDNGIIHNLIKNSYNNITKENIQLKTESKADINSKNISNKSVQAPEELKSVKQDKYFCIVLASRVTKKNADAFVTKLTTKGYEASTLIEGNKSIKVVYGKYKTRNDAYNALNDLRGNEFFYDAWVYQIK